MRVLITGLPMFAKQHAKHLSEKDPGNKYLFFDTYQSKWEQLRFLLHLPFCNLVISMNGVTDKSGILDWVLFFKKKLVLQWMGTDCMLAVERFNAGTISRKYTDYAINASDIEWLADELKIAQIPTISLPFKFSEIENQPVERYEEMSVVTYVAQNRQIFYGLDWVISAANAFPDIPFEVYGMDSPELECPENMIFKGWQPTHIFREAVLQSPIFLRFTEHDGFSISVIEALSTGAEILFTHPSEFTTLVNAKDLVVPEMQKAIDRVRNRDLKPDLETRNASLKHFNKETVLTNYINTIKSFGK